jgi:hypothetical protein
VLNLPKPAKIDYIKVTTFYPKFFPIEYEITGETMILNQLNTKKGNYLLRFYGLILFVWTLQHSSTFAATYFVAPDGDDTNPGTLDKPFATMQKGHDKAVAGDTVYLRGGTYKIKTGASSLIGISITKSGKSDKERIRFWAYKDELPILDFVDLKLGSGIGAGIRVQGQWLHFRGIEICNVMAPTGANNGIWCNPCTHNIFENLNLHHNQGPGLSIANGEGDLLVLNCDSHDNFDVAKNGEDGDGFGIHYQTKGDTIRLRGCRSWWNSDDGYDFFQQQFACIVENCWAYGNGYINSGTGNGQNGSGFKMGNSKSPKVRHTIRNCVSWGNKNQGFYANHSPGGTNWYNNTSFKNGYQFDMLSDSVLSGTLVHVLRNNISFPEKIRNPGASDMKFNTWNLSITPADGDFESVKDDGWKGPRKADGSLPDVTFLKLRMNSNMIDKGTDVGLPFTGTAPDLGAYESGLKTAVYTKPMESPGVSNVSAYKSQMTYKYFDLSGREMTIRHAQQGNGIIICRGTSGYQKLLLLLTPTKQYEQRK